MVTVNEMLATGKHTLEKVHVDATKIVIYEWLSRLLQAEGFPDDQLVEFKEANICDFVAAFLIPVVSDLSPLRDMRLYREKGVVATDWETGGNEDFVAMEKVEIGERERFVFILEAKRDNVGEATKQCLLAMKDSWENNNHEIKGGYIYGFVTTATTWDMYRYDGKSFAAVYKLPGVVRGMEKSKEEWLKHQSIIVDCLFCALCHRGQGVSRKHVARKGRC